MLKKVRRKHSQPPKQLVLQFLNDFATQNYGTATKKWM